PATLTGSPQLEKKNAQIVAACRPCRDFVAFRAEETSLKLCRSSFRLCLMGGTGMTRRFRWQALALAGILLTSPALAEPNYPDRDKPDVDLYALMSGKCPTLKIAGHTFPCKAVAY